MSFISIKPLRVNLKSNIPTDFYLLIQQNQNSKRLTNICKKDKKYISFNEEFTFSLKDFNVFDFRLYEYSLDINSNGKLGECQISFPKKGSQSEEIRFLDLKDNNHSIGSLTLTTTVFDQQSDYLEEDSQTTLADEMEVQSRPSIKKMMPSHPKMARKNASFNIMEEIDRLKGKVEIPSFFKPPPPVTTSKREQRCYCPGCRYPNPYFSPYGFMGIP